MANQLDVTNDPRSDDEDLQADKEYQIANIESLRKDINVGIDRAIERIKDSTTRDGVWQAHKSLLNGISWTAKELRDQQLEEAVDKLRQNGTSYQELARLA